MTHPTKPTQSTSTPRPNPRKPTKPTTPGSRPASDGAGAAVPCWPILSSGEMVRAILDGRKTQTRRVIVPQPPWWVDSFGFTAFTPDGNISGRGNYGDEGPAEKFFRLKYGKPGDRLWVRETFSYSSKSKPTLDAALTERPAVLYYASDNPRYRDKDKWKPSIHMPRWASRLTLELLDVRVERVQEISEADAKAEGVPLPAGRYVDSAPAYTASGERVPSEDLPVWRLRFADLWDTINQKRGYGWDVNPWVWALTFRRCEP